jgi:hypothetical protein
MEREKALAIAKIAYREIVSAVEDVENATGTLCYWEGLISIDEYTFSPWELKENVGK